MTCSAASASARPSRRNSSATAPARAWRTCRSCSTQVGLTSVHNAGASQDHILAYEDCQKNGELTHRAYMMIRSPQAFSGLKAANIHTGFGDEWIRVGGVKFVADGSASERTMRMSTPYVGTTDYGILTMTQEQIHEAVDDAHTPQLPGRHPRQRRRDDRHGAEGVRAGAAEVARPEPAAPDRALHAGQSRSDPPHQGERRHPDAVLDLRLLPRREVDASTATRRCGGCSRTGRSSTPASACRARPTTRPARSSR